MSLNREVLCFRKTSCQWYKMRLALLSVVNTLHCSNTMDTHTRSAGCHYSSERACAHQCFVLSLLRFAEASFPGLFYQYLQSINGPNLSPIGSSAYLYPLLALSYLSAVRPTDRIVPHLFCGSLPLFEPLITPTSRWTSLPGSVLFAVRHCYGSHSATPGLQVPATI